MPSSAKAPSYIEPLSPDSDSLAAIRNKVAEARDILEQLAQKEEELKALRSRYTELTRVTLPEMFSASGTTIVGLEAKGNHLAVEAKRKPYYRANIAADWPAERRAAAFDYLVKQKAGDLIRNIFTIPFGKNTIKQQKAVAAFLRKSKLDFDAKRSVPHGTLTAWLRAEVEAGRLPKLDLIGGDIGEIVELKTPEN